MALVDALQSASIRLVGRKPTAFFGATGQFEMELLDLVNEVAADVAAYQDWQALQAVAQLVGAGSTTEFDLPADYSRMMQNALVQDATSWAWGYAAYSDINAFLNDEARGFTFTPGGWILYGNRLRFAPAPTGEAVFPYISANWAASTDGTRKPAFTADDDTFLLSERLLTLGLVWRWRENKKLDASGDQEAFIKALDEYASKDRGGRIYRFGGSGRIRNTVLAYTGRA